MAKTKTKKASRVELGAQSIIEDIGYMLDPDPLKLKVVQDRIVEILDHAQTIGIFYEFRDRSIVDAGDVGAIEGREGYASAFNKFEKSISAFDKHMASTRSYSLVNGKNPMDHVLKIIRTCSKFLAAIS